jgi:hypothetical protein
MDNWKEIGISLGLRWPFTEQDVADEQEHIRRIPQPEMTGREFLDFVENYNKKRKENDTGN